MPTDTTGETSNVKRKELLTGSKDSVNKQDVGRRGMVKGLFASVASVFGFSTASRASSGSGDVSRVTRLNDATNVKKYDSPDAIETAFREHEDMLEILHEQTTLESATASGLQIDSEDIEGDEWITTRQINGQVTPEIRLFRRTERGGLTVAIQPETGERYAIRAIDGEPHVVDEVTTSGCSDSCCDEVMKCCAWDTPDCGATACDPYCVQYCYTCGNCNCNLSCATHCV